MSAACFTQFGMVGDDDGDGLHCDYGKMGLESDFSLPPLEISRSNNNIEVPINNNSNVKSHNNNNHFNNSCFNNTDDQIQNSNIVVEDLFGFGNHNGQAGENLRMGEWDLEGLMQDMSFFPSLDFQV